MSAVDPAAQMAEFNRKYREWLATPLDRAGWLDLLHRCQNGEASCLYVLEKIEAELDAAHDEIQRLRALGTVYRAPDHWDYPGMGGGPELEDCEKIDLKTY